ncbi:MAG: co-chaperone GroES [Ignavibacteriales bacterium]|nr:co-chaperone GroES [Ignavibacteriales bacterium]
MANFKIQPLQDRVIVKPKEAEETTKGGIILPDTVKEKPFEGTVVAVGGGKILDNGTVAKLTVKVGDIVLYSKYSTSDIKVEGEDYLIVRESDILGIVK